MAYPENDALSLVEAITDQLFSDQHQLSILTQTHHVLLTLENI